MSRIARVWSSATVPTVCRSQVPFAVSCFRLRWSAACSGCLTAVLATQSAALSPAPSTWVAQYMAQSSGFWLLHITPIWPSKATIEEMSSEVSVSAPGRLGGAHAVRHPDFVGLGEGPPGHAGRVGLEDDGLDAAARHGDREAAVERVGLGDAVVGEAQDLGAGRLAGGEDGGGHAP